VIVRSGLLIPPRGKINIPLDNFLLEIVFSFFDLDPHLEGEIAKRLGVDIATIRKKIEVLRERGLHVSARPNIARLKLRGIIAVVEFTKVISEGTRLNLLKVGPYWRYINRGYESTRKVYVANYALPLNHVNNLKAYLEMLKKRGLVASYSIYDFVNTLYNKFSMEYYDYKRRKWQVNPMDWAHDIITSSNNSVPDIFSEDLYNEGTRLDKIDLIMLEKLEAYGLTPLYSFASKLDISPQQVYVHYFNHIRRQNLILQYVPLLYTVYPSLAFKILLVRKVNRKDTLGNIINVSQGRPFLVATCANPYSDTVILIFSLVRTALVLLYNAIDYLTEIGLVKNYRMILLDDLIIGQSIPYAKAYDFGRYRWRAPRFPQVEDILKIRHEEI